MNELTEQNLPTLVNALRSDGWSHRPHFFDAATVAALRADLERHRALFEVAAIGRAQQRQQRSSIRADETCWLRDTGSAQRTFCEAMEVVRLALNRHLYLGLFDYEAHYAHYRPGAGYQRHLDTFDNAVGRGPQRVLSTVCYLNTDWCADYGGELVLWDCNDNEVARVVPNAGSAIFFLSAEFPHAVRPATVDRYSIAGWFRAQGAGL